MYIYYNNYIDMYSGYNLIYGMELTIDDIILLFDLEEDYYEEEENIFEIQDRIYNRDNFCISWL